MTPEFLKIMSRVFGWEGGIANDPNDRGGYTNMGITIPFLSQYLGRPATREDIDNLDHGTSLKAYYKNIWLGMRMESFPEWARPVMFSAVCGSMILYGRMVRRLQALVGTPVDGVWGKDSRAAADAILATKTEPQLANGVALALGEEYMKICSADYSQRVYAAGWYRRAYELSRLDAKEANRSLHAALFKALGNIARGLSDEDPLVIYRRAVEAFDLGR